MNLHPRLQDAVLCALLLLFCGCDSAGSEERSNPVWFQEVWGTYDLVKVGLVTPIAGSMYLGEFVDPQNGRTYKYWISDHVTTFQPDGTVIQHGVESTAYVNDNGSWGLIRTDSFRTEFKLEYEWTEMPEGEVWAHIPESSPWIFYVHPNGELRDFVGGKWNFWQKRKY